MDVEDVRSDGILKRISGSAAVKKLKKIKNIQLIAAVFIIAAALLIYSTVIGNREQRSGDDAPAATDTMDGEETRLAAMLSGIEGAGRVQTMITRRGDEIVGVLVLAEGAEDITVLLDLLNATTTALGVDKKLVEIYRLK